MKTHLPTGLRKALIAAIFAVSAVAYNAQAATEYNVDTTVDAIDTTQESYDKRSISIGGGVTVTTEKGGVIANGITVGEYATLNSKAEVATKSDGNITVQRGAQVTVEVGAIKADGDFKASDHTTLTTKDGGITGDDVTISDYSTATLNGHVEANGVLTIDDNTKVNVKNGHITSTGFIEILNESQVTVKNGYVATDGELFVSSTVASTKPHLSVTGGNITAQGAMITNANVKTDGKLETTAGSLNLADKATVTATEAITVADGRVEVSDGSLLKTEGAITVTGTHQDVCVQGGTVEAASVTAQNHVYVNAGGSADASGSLTVTGAVIAKEGTVSVDDNSTLKADTVEAALAVDVQNGGDLTADTLIQAGHNLKVLGGSIKGTADIIAMGGTDEHDDKDITIEDSTVEGASLTSVKGNITIKTTDETLAALEEHPELTTSAVELTGDMKAEVGSITITKADVNVGGKVVADKGLKVEGIEVTDEETTGNTLQTGDIIVANLVAQNDTMTKIQDIADNGSLMPDTKIDAAVGAVSQMAMDLKGVSITNVAEGSTVGEVASVGNITIKGSTLTAGSLTADVSELSQAVKDKVQTSIGNDAADAVSTYLPLAHISVSESDVTVLGEVYSETEIDVKDGSLLAEGNVTAADGNITATNADIASADMTVEHGFVKVEGGSLLATGAVIADAGLTATGDTEKGSMIQAGSITVENTMATNATLNNLQMIKADPMIEQEDKAWHVNSEIGALSDQLKGVSIADMAEGSAVGDVVSVGDITIKGSTLTAGSLKADDSELSKTVNDKVVELFGAEVAKEVADGLPLAKITVTDSVVEVTGDVFSETTLDVTKSDFASGNVSADAGVTIKGEDKIVEGSDKQDNRNTIAMGDITVENKAAIADAVDTIAEAKALIGTDFADAEEALAALAARKNELQQSLGDVSIENVRKSSVGAVSTNGDITIKGSNMTADSLTADATDVREALTGAITAQFGAEAAEKLADSLPTVSITVEDSKVKVKGEVTSDTEIKVTNGGLLAKGDVTANDGNITATNADLASADMTAEHGRIDVLGGSLDATGDVKADGGLTVVGNAEGTSSLNAASITVENKDLVVTLQDRLKEIQDDPSIPGPDKRDIAEVAINEVSHLVNGVTVKGVTSGTVGDVASVGHITITGSELTTGSLTTDASDLREGFSTVTEELFDVLSGHAAESVPAPTITVQGSTLTVEGDMTSESTIKTTDSIVKVTGDVTALANGITISGGKLIAEGTVSAPQQVTVYEATLQAQTIEAKRLSVNDGSKVKVEDTITADIHGNGGTITSTGTEGKGLTIVGNVKSDGVAIRTPQGGDIVIGDVTDTIPGVGNITGKQNEVTVKGDGDISVLGNIAGDENALKVTGNGGITVNGTISGDSTTLTTKGEGDIHVNKINNTEGTTMTAANGDITIDTLSNLHKQMTVKSTKGGVKVTNDSNATLTESAITAKEDITIGDDSASSAMMGLTGGTTVTSTKGDITLNQSIAATGENTAITAAKGTVTFAGSENNYLGEKATVTAKTIELAEDAKLTLVADSADALQGGLSGTGSIYASADNLNRAADFDDSAFNGYIGMSGAHTLTIANTGVGADAVIGLNEGADLNVTSTGASLGTVHAGNGADVTINAGTIDTTTTASAIVMLGEATLNIDASAESADLITVTEGVMMDAHTVRVTAQESLESIEGDVRHTIIKLAEGAVNEGVSEEVKYDLVDGQRKLQGKNINLVNAGDHVDLVISTNFRGTENTKPNQEAVNVTLKELSAEVPHNPGVLAEMHSDLAHVLDALDNTRSEGETLRALQSLSAAGNLVVTNMMMDSSRNHLSTLRSHMGEPVCKGTTTGGNMWAAYTGGHDFIGADEYTGDYTRQHQGAIIGTDYSLSCNASMGLSLGYEHSIGHQDSVRAEADTMFADLYTTVKTGALTQRFSAGVALHDIDTKRNASISAAAHTYTGNSTGSMDALTVNLGYEVSYDVKLGSASTLTPFAAIDVAIHQMDTLREKGQGDASVITEYDEPVQVDVALGAAYTYRFASGAALSASAAIHGELSEKQPEATNRFAGVGSSWTTKSAERKPIYGEIGAAVVLPVSTTTSLIGGGNFEFSSDRISVGGNVGLNVKF